MRCLIQHFTATVLIIANATAHNILQQPLISPNHLSEPTFGVGFDLSASYASAAISFSNGTTLTIATIPTKEGYNEVLQRLSLHSSRHPSPPYNNLDESWKDMPRQYMRKARKAIGLPASSDVSYLASTISELRTAVEKEVGPISSAGVTTMNLVALYDEDLHNAFEYVGLEYVTFSVGYVGHNILYQTSAAYAGYGYGLCSDYKTDPEACKNEQYNMTDEVVMAVIYSDTVLSASLSIMKSAYSLWEPQYRYRSNFDLGYNAAEQTDSEEYWGRVEVELQSIMIENPYYERPGKVLLMGDRTDDSDFRETLYRALGEQMDELPGIFGDGAVGVAARGVAEMTKRMEYQAQGLSGT